MKYLTLPEPNKSGNPRKVTELNCSVCNKTFWESNALADRNSKDYCSVACYLKGRGIKEGVFYQKRAGRPKIKMYKDYLREMKAREREILRKRTNLV